MQGRPVAAAAETLNVMPNSAAPTHRFGALALAASLLAGCTTVGDGLFAGDKVDYRNSPVKTTPLEVPPDLSQLARESRYQAQGGVISAAAAAGGASAPAAGAGVGGTLPASVALANLGALRVERDGQQRWLVVPLAPEQLWPQLKNFWSESGFTLAEENASTGVMETNWSENRAKVGADAVGGIFNRLLGRLIDTGERDRYRTRVERTATGSEVYITHRGVTEVYTSERRDNTTWQARPNDPQLEAEFLSRLMVALGQKSEPARAAVAAAAPASAPVAPLAAAATRPAAASQATSLMVSDTFDRAWRRVGLALDRTGFTVEDRDRAAGLYYVRYVDPRNAGKEEPGWWARLWGDKSNPQEALRYRVLVKGDGGKTNVSVQNSVGVPETGENAQRILGLLSNELR
jgi:outer membrane protein assembly factor BamC